jgi:4-amino-4-deoxy-L-arabinose transferase-like glycosyltransferase
MAIAAAPIFFDYVVSYLNFAVLLFALAVQAVALIHCLTQRGPGFQAIGTLPKGAWAGIIGVCLALTLLTKGTLIIISMIGIAAALIYMLDVRPGLKDLSDGKGFW